jgi:serine protease Do
MPGRLTITGLCRSVLFAVGVLVLPARAQELAPTGQAALIRSLLPTVVNISARALSDDVAPLPVPDGKNASASNERQPSAYRSKVSSGSGFVIDPAGVIVTNWHAVSGAYEIFVTFDDGLRVRAKVQAHTRIVDIALLKVEVDRPLTPIVWGNSDELRVGDPVLAIGNPLGVGESVTAGIISALNRNISDTPYDEFIQTDAAINHGSSGGPLFDTSGHVIGVATAIISPSAGSAGLGFAIPSNQAQFAIGRLLKYGFIKPGWLGMILQEVTPNVAAALRMQQPAGSIIADVAADGPAERAGLHVGDIILRVGDTTPHDERALLRELGRRVAGDVVTLTVQRGGAVLALTATVGEWPKALLEAFDPPDTVRLPPSEIPPDLGLHLAELTQDARSRFRLGPAQPGVLITAVDAGSVAAENSFQPGDVILRVGETDVRTPDEVQQQFDAARAQQQSYVLALMMSKSVKTAGPRWFPLQVLPE